MVFGVSPGEATITVTAVLGGCSASCIVTVKDPIGITDYLADQIVLYPNPSNNIINIKIENTNYTTIEIYDITGDLKFNTGTNSKNVKIDVSDYTTGIYLIKVKQDDKIYIEKVIVR